MASPWIVRYGAMRFLGEFDPENVIYARGQEVVVRTERGLELGQVLCPSTPRAIELIGEPTRGRIIRVQTERDQGERERLREAEQRELETCARFVEQRRLQMELVDVEHL